jgi:hypothetical protein
MAKNIEEYVVNKIIHYVKFGPIFKKRAEQSYYLAENVRKEHFQLYLDYMHSHIDKYASDGMMYVDLDKQYNIMQFEKSAYYKKKGNYDSSHFDEFLKSKIKDVLQEEGYTFLMTSSGNIRISWDKSQK